MRKVATLGLGLGQAAITAIAAAGATLVRVGDDVEVKAQQPEKQPIGTPLEEHRAARPLSRYFTKRPMIAGSIAEGNRWGGAHEHRREAARRIRQEKRAWENRRIRGLAYIGNDFYSRTGRPVYEEA